MKFLFSFLMVLAGALYLTYVVHLFRVGLPQPLLLHLLAVICLYVLSLLCRKRKPENR